MPHVFGQASLATTPSLPTRPQRFSGFLATWSHLGVGVSVVILHRLRCGYADDQGGETSHFSEAEREFRHEKERSHDSNYNSNYKEQEHKHT